ncbi:MAG: 1,4-alpha-glucan-branching enzyme, partial [Bacteroidales bacterium]|nr:1,4-alpha-glucan-branching enzyme [Bacteroidales bacterium]
TIAEEVSGMPGLATPVKEGGIGFDYRMAMGIPDFWIKLIKEYSDEDWKPGTIWWELTNRRKEEKTISYAESHDQALVGDKTIIFRLIDADMYWHMNKEDQHMVVDRGIALHKMIRLMTASTINGGYLNFMGNEFGHPEWIDFPRQCNGWSYKYARRQWSLLENQQLRYADLLAFDKAMIQLLKKNSKELPCQRWLHDQDQIMAFERGPLLFVFNLHPSRSYTDYGILVQKGSYKTVLDSDSKEFGGFGLVDDQIVHTTTPAPENQGSGLEWIHLYLPSRTALVLKLQ